MRPAVGRHNPAWFQRCRSSPNLRDHLLIPRSKVRILHGPCRNWANERVLSPPAADTTLQGPRRGPRPPARRRPSRDLLQVEPAASTEPAPLRVPSAGQSGGSTGGRRKPFTPNRKLALGWDRRPRVKSKSRFASSQACLRASFMPSSPTSSRVALARTLRPAAGVAGDALGQRPDPSLL
jgi:hypothetical protein